MQVSQYLIPYLFQKGLGKYNVSSDGFKQRLEGIQKKLAVPVQVSFTLNWASTVSENPSFRVADFTTLPDERRSRSKINLLFNMDKEPYFRKFEELTRSKILGILQTE